MFPVQFRDNPAYSVDSNVFVEFSSGDHRTVSGFHSSTVHGGGYAQLSSPYPTNGLYLTIKANAEL